MTVAGQYHCRRTRTKMVAMVSDTRAIIANDQRLANMSPGAMALRKLPSTMTRKWVSGIACASHCSSMGMFSTGVANPDIRTDGTPMAKAPRLACCWVALIAEIIRPMPTHDRMNRTREKKNRQKEQKKG